MHATEGAPAQMADRSAMQRYGALRAWARFLVVIGVIGMISAAFGTIVWATQVSGFWRVLGVLLIGGPISIFFASLPVAFAQAMDVLADVAERMPPA